MEFYGIGINDEVTSGIEEVKKTLISHIELGNHSLFSGSLTLNEKIILISIQIVSPANWLRMLEAL